MDTRTNIGWTCAYCGAPLPDANKYGARNGMVEGCPACGVLNRWGYYALNRWPGDTGTGGLENRYHILPTGQTAGEMRIEFRFSGEARAVIAENAIVRRLKALEDGATLPPAWGIIDDVNRVENIVTVYVTATDDEAARLVRLVQLAAGSTAQVAYERIQGEEEKEE